MRRLLLLALMGMALSKLYFGSLVPPELRIIRKPYELARVVSRSRWLGILAVETAVGVFVFRGHWCSLLRSLSLTARAGGARNRASVGLARSWANLRSRRPGAQPSGSDASR